MKYGKSYQLIPIGDPVECAKWYDWARQRFVQLDTQRTDFFKKVLSVEGATIIIQRSMESRKIIVMASGYAFVFQIREAVEVGADPYWPGNDSDYYHMLIPMGEGFRYKGITQAELLTKYGVDNSSAFSLTDKSGKRSVISDAQGEVFYLGNPKGNKVVFDLPAASLGDFDAHDCGMTISHLFLLLLSELEGYKLLSIPLSNATTGLNDYTVEDSYTFTDTALKEGVEGEVVEDGVTTTYTVPDYIKERLVSCSFRSDYRKAVVITYKNRIEYDFSYDESGNLDVDIDVEAIAQPSQPQGTRTGTITTVFATETTITRTAESAASYSLSVPIGILWAEDGTYTLINADHSVNDTFSYENIYRSRPPAGPPTPYAGHRGYERTSSETTEFSIALSGAVVGELYFESVADVQAGDEEVGYSDDFTETLERQLDTVLRDGAIAGPVPYGVHEYMAGVEVTDSTTTMIEPSFLPEETSGDIENGTTDLVDLFSPWAQTAISTYVYGITDSTRRTYTNIGRKFAHTNPNGYWAFVDGDLISRSGVNGSDTVAQFFPDSLGTYPANAVWQDLFIVRLN